MAHRLKTTAGRALYKLREETVEPVFGIIKEVLGFRRFSLRGLEKVTLEWTLVCVSYNLKRLFNLKNQAAPACPPAGTIAPAKHPAISKNTTERKPRRAKLDFPPIFVLTKITAGEKLKFPFFQSDNLLVKN